MKITDYESGKSLRDVGLQLSVEEATELRDYLNRLVQEPSVANAYLTEVSDRGLERELSIRIERKEALGSVSTRPLPLPRHKRLVSA